jgi:PAS domain S-box-containing protein
LVGTLSDPVAVLGPDGRIARANAALGNLLGLPVSELIGVDALRFVPPEELARAVDGIQYATTFPDRTALVAYCLQRPDGRRAPVEITSSVLHHPSGDQLVLILRDAPPARPSRTPCGP